jgi:hypothetical protein
MKTFANRDEAKQFFIDQILAEAKVENEPLSAIEAKMLWFTEVYPVPGMSKNELYKMNAEFDQQFSMDEWETKITGLIERAYKRYPEPEDYRAAYAVIADEDHYLMVMLNAALGLRV